MPTQSTDIFNTTTINPALGFSADPQTWTISAGVVVSSTLLYGVDSGFNDSTLFNFGQVFSGKSSGVVFFGDNGTIVNEAGAAITGLDQGISLQGNHDTIDNIGSIVGLAEGVFLSNFSNNAQLINRGSIRGHFDGVAAFSNNGIITNFDAIRSDQVGVEVDTHAGFTTLISNAAKGIIVGRTDAIKTIFNGAIFLNNHGTVIGNIDCTVAGANDVIINHGKIKGEVLLHSGNDVFNGKGGTSGAIFAGAGNDRVIAGIGNAKIHVGSGKDTLTAGPGHDQFIFDTALTGQVEKITNFNPSRDKIVLSRADFAGIGPVGHPLAAADFHSGGHALKPSQHIVYNANTGFLFYDSDGSGPNAQIPFATVSPHLALTHADFLVEA